MNLKKEVIVIPRRGVVMNIANRKKMNISRIYVSGTSTLHGG